MKLSSVSRVSGFGAWTLVPSRRQICWSVSPRRGRVRAAAAEDHRGGSARQNTELAGAVLQSALQQQAAGIANLSSALQRGAARLSNIVQPLPQNFPPGPDGDAALSLAANPLAFLERVSQQYGGAVGLKLGGEKVVLISDPALAKKVLVTRADVFIKAGTAFFPGSSLAGNGLLVSDGEVWKRQRRLSNPAFRKAAVDAYGKAMVEETLAMAASKWRSGGERDVYSDLKELTLRIVAGALFGSAGRQGLEEVIPAITAAFEFFQRRATSMIIVPEWVPTPENLQFAAAVAQLDRVVYRIIAESRAKQGHSSSQEPKDLLSRLLESRDEDGSGMNDQSLRDELMTMMIAGQETSAILLGWAAGLLAQHPAVLEKLTAEVRTVLGPDKLPTSADVANLKYMEAVIYETMRLLPPAYIVGRCACEDAELAQWKLPAGTTVLVSPYLLHRNPAYWPRPLEFEPERWLVGGSATAPSENDAYWPFGGGPRNCIGMGFAMMEVALVLAVLVQKYKFCLAPGVPLPKPQPVITLRPEADSLKLKLIVRRLSSHI